MSHPVIDMTREKKIPVVQVVKNEAKRFTDHDTWTVQIMRWEQDPSKVERPLTIVSTQEIGTFETRAEAEGASVLLWKAIVDAHEVGERKAGQ